MLMNSIAIVTTRRGISQRFQSTAHGGHRRAVLLIVHTEQGDLSATNRHVLSPVSYWVNVPRVHLCAVGTNLRFHVAHLKRNNNNELELDCNTHESLNFSPILLGEGFELEETPVNETRAFPRIVYALITAKMQVYILFVKCLNCN